MTLPVYAGGLQALGYQSFTEARQSISEYIVGY
jgi:hypothetical protein